MPRNERLDEIINILRESHYSTVVDLAEKLYTSPSSIRRDLAILEKQRLVVRVRGGVKICNSDNLDFSFTFRVKSNVDEKKIIAAKAAKLLREGDIVFVDSSSTCFYLVQEIAKLSGITVVTNGIYAAQYLSAYDVEVICVGGRLDSVERSSMVGTDACRTISTICANYAFFSPHAVDENGVCYDCYRELIAVINSMMGNSLKKVILLDETKVGKKSSFKECTLEDTDICISNVSLDSLYRKRFPKVKFL